MLGKHGGPPVVVRRRTSWLHTALWIAGVLIGVFALYVVYELGRYNAGYDRQAVAQQRTELEVQIERLEKANREMRIRLAELDTFRVGRSREQAEVARTMGDLQAQVARQSQELAFYRGVVAQGAASVGVKIEQLRITAGQRPASYIVHMSLGRSGRADAPATGSAQLSVDGTAGGGAGCGQRAARRGRYAGRGCAHARFRGTARGPPARAALQLPLPAELRP